VIKEMTLFQIDFIFGQNLTLYKTKINEN